MREKGNSLSSFASFASVTYSKTNSIIFPNPKIKGSLIPLRMYSLLLTVEMKWKRLDEGVVKTFISLRFCDSMT